MNTYTVTLVATVLVESTDEDSALREAKRLVNNYGFDTEDWEVDEESIAED